MGMEERSVKNSSERRTSGQRSGSILKSSNSASSIPIFQGWSGLRNLSIRSTENHKSFQSINSDISAQSSLNNSLIENRKVSSQVKRRSSIPRLISLPNVNRRQDGEILLRNLLDRNLAKNSQSLNLLPTIFQEQIQLNTAQSQLNPGIVPRNNLIDSSSKIQSSRLIQPSLFSTMSNFYNFKFGNGISTGKQTIPRNMHSSVLHYESVLKIRAEINRFFHLIEIKDKASFQREFPNKASNEDCIGGGEAIETYVCDILFREYTNEPKYVISKNLEKQEAKRSDMVRWIKKVGLSLELELTTIHIAVLIIDRFLALNVVPIYSTELISAAAIFIASKSEETNYRPDYSDLCSHVTAGYNFSCKRLISAESKILRTLGFRISSVTSQFAMEACVNRLNYPNSTFQQFCKILAEQILLDSLTELDLMESSNFKKARLALHYAVKHVSQNFPLLKIVSDNCGDMRSALSRLRLKCFPDFRAAVSNSVTQAKSHSATRSKSTSARNGGIIALNDVTNKTKTRGERRPHSGSEATTNHSSTRRLRLK